MQNIYLKIIFVKSRSWWSNYIYFSVFRSHKQLCRVWNILHNESYEDVDYSILEIMLFFLIHHFQFWYVVWILPISILCTWYARRKIKVFREKMILSRFHKISVLLFYCTFCGLMKTYYNIRIHHDI